MVEHSDRVIFTENDLIRCDRRDIGIGKAICSKGEGIIVKIDTGEFCS